MPRMGRRPGGADTRGQIVAAARREFAQHGYTGATVRDIAGKAGVDPALLYHYFETKRDLFVASLELPFDPGEVASAATDGDRGGAGERMLRRLLALWATEHGAETMQSLLRSALADEQIMRMLREFIVETVLSVIVSELSPDRHRLRAALLGSQVIGLALARHVARIEPLASADHDTVVAAVAPTLQRYLTGDLADT